MDKITQLHNLINQSQNIVFLTGAGVSTPSGITDFETIYSQRFMGFETIDIMTSGFLDEYPDVFWKFIKKYFSQSVEPNSCHKYISLLQQNKSVTVITQNIDNLHQKARTKNVIELHGTFQKWHCSSCHQNYNFEEVLKNDNLLCPFDYGIIRPNAVFYNEEISRLTIYNAQRSIENADTLIVAGTSLQTELPVYLIKKFVGKNLVVINRNHVKLDTTINLEINDDIKTVFDKLTFLNESKTENIIEFK